MNEFEELLEDYKIAIQRISIAKSELENAEMDLSKTKEKLVLSFGKTFQP